MKKSGKLLTVAFLLAVLGLIASGIYFLLKKEKITEGQRKGFQQLTPTPSPTDVTSGWETYLNPEYGFSIKHPRFLYPIETKNTGGYLIFVRFVENNFSQGKGVAIGVRKTALSDEVEKIKKELSQGIKATLVDEKKIEVGLPGVKLEYEPVNPDHGEEKVIVILNNGKYSFSISTTPEQINAVAASFRLTGNFRGCKEILSSEGEQTFLQSYCQGDFCFPEKTKEVCERVDVVKMQEGGLSEESGKDGIGDCVWEEKATPNQCRPRY